MKYAIGVDIGGTNIRAGLVDENGRLGETASFKTDPGRSTDAILMELADRIRGLVAHIPGKADRLAAVGVGSPGTADDENGVVVYASNLPFRNAPVRKILQDATGLPVHVANDAGCAALAEARVGAARGAQHAVLVTIGTGIGCGMVLDGRLYRGFNGAAGEFGHSVLVRDGVMCPCGRKGCVEMYASATALIRQTEEAIAAHPGSEMERIREKWGRVSAQTAFQAMKAGDPDAKTVVDAYIGWLSETVTNLVNILMPEVVLLGGGVANEGAALLDPVRAFCDTHAYYGEGVAHTRIDGALLGNKAGMVGAALMALDAEE